jgi:PhoH-like ATPase
MNEQYTGYIELELNGDEINELYQDGTISNYDFNENEYILVTHNGKLIDTYCYQDGILRKVGYNTTSNMYLGQIKPRNTQQNLVLDMLQDKSTKVKLVKGVYGSGKDYLMLSQALSLIEKGKFDKIVFIRPNITVADLPDIGALPGTADEKLAWTLGPFLDKVGGQEGVNMLIHSGQLEVVPLIFIRGRSFSNSIIYVTEGQNMTTEITKLILGRVGEGSELWINADNRQTDKKVFEKDNGVRKLVDKLTGHPLFGYVYMPLTERSDVANLANLLDEE